MDSTEHDGLSLWFTASLLLLFLLSLPFYFRLWNRIRRIWQKRDPNQSLIDAALPPRRRLESPLGLIDVVIVFVCWFLVQSIAIAVVLPVAREGHESTAISASALTIASSGQLLGTLLGVGVICMRHRKGLRIFGWQPEYLIPDTKLALITFCMTLPGLLLVQSQLAKLIPYRHGTLEMLVDHFDVATIAATWFSAGLIAPLTEELFFRSTLQGWLQRLHRGMSEIKFLLVISGGFSTPFERESPQDGLGNTSNRTLPSSDSASAPRHVLPDSQSVWLPILLSSAAFGAVHIGQGAAPVALFLFGIVLGIVYRQRGSLWACFLLHALLNAFTLFWANLQMWFAATDALF